MFALWYMLIEHGQALEADFARFYGIDLADLYRGWLGARKAAVLAVHLPAESAVMRREGGSAALTGVEQILMGTNHRLEMLMYQNGGGKGKKPEPPKPPETHMERKNKQQRLWAKQARALRQREEYSQRALKAAQKMQ